MKRSFSVNLESILKKILPFSIQKKMPLPVFKSRAVSSGLEIESNSHYNVRSGQKIVRITKDHLIFLGDMINSFEYYYAAVVPFQYTGY